MRPHDRAMERSSDSLAPPQAHARRAARLAALSAGGAALTALTLSAAASLLAAGRLVAPPPLPRRDVVRLLPSRMPRTVRLAGEAARTPGRWGVAYPGGYVQVGRVVLAHSDGSVSRRVVHRFGPEPDLGEEGVDAAFDRVAFPADATLAASVFPSLEVLDVTGLNGAALPLWHLPPTTPSGPLSGVPVVGAHGRGVSPAEMLRLSAPCRRLGAGLWMVSYRNDPLVRADAHTPMELGRGEADDLWLQLAHAVESTGASSVVLAGVSLGGAAVANLLLRHARHLGDDRLELPLPRLHDGRLEPDPDRVSVTVAGVLLEAAALHWPGIVAEVAAGMRLPRLLAVPTLMAARLRVRLDPVALSPLTALERAASPAPAALIIHGSGDVVVPVSVSDRLVAAWPAAGYLRLVGVGHARAFNEAYERYLAAVTRFLQTVATGSAI